MDCVFFILVFLFKSLFDLLKWKVLSKRVACPKIVCAQVGIHPADRVEGLQITPIGHASYLVQTGYHNILVDPVRAERASPLE